MSLGIVVFCDACGTELKVTDVRTDNLLRVTLKTRPCGKCSRPPDCHLTCEDVMNAKKELKEARNTVYPKCFGSSKNDKECTNCSFIQGCAKTEEEECPETSGDKTLDEVKKTGQEITEDMIKKGCL